MVFVLAVAAVSVASGGSGPITALVSNFAPLIVFVIYNNGNVAN